MSDTEIRYDVDLDRWLRLSKTKITLTPLMPHVNVLST
jgi:hypothetical protein